MHMAFVLVYKLLGYELREIVPDPPPPQPYPFPPNYGEIKPLATYSPWTGDEEFQSVYSAVRRNTLVATDIVVYVLVLALAAVPFFLYEKAPDFVNTDVHYVDLMDSLLHSHSYASNFTPEKLQPPGLSLILAFICTIVGCTHDILIRTMPVFLALGLLFSYEVVRRQRGRFIAAASCLLLAASPSIFPWVTSWISPTYSYFFISMAVFLLIPKLEASQRGSRTIVAVLLLCFFVTAAVMIESSGIALIAAMLGWLVLSFFGNNEIARLRVRRFLPIVLVALLAEGLWLQQGGNRRDWPLPGYPQGYLAQMKLKDGNDPEMGFATLKDVVVRVEKNLKENVIFLAQTLLQYQIRPSWTSPLIAGFTILILCGLWSSLWRSNSQLCALYFIFYECIWLFWPWLNGVFRFAVAVLPLACLYLVEGVLALRQWSRQYPRTVGTLILPLSTLLALVAAMRGWAGGGLVIGFQEKLSAIFWIVCAVLGVGLIWKGSLPSWRRLSWVHSFFDKRYSVIDAKSSEVVMGLSFRPIKLLAVLAVTYLVATGVAAEIPIGRENLVSGSTKFESTPEIQAARWIDSHTDPNAIIAASLQPLIYHYSKRRVIWFPPISNPTVLMEGIRKHHIGYVVVIDRNWYYYRPPETTCFDLLYKAYPQGFRLAETIGHAKIYAVLADGKN